MLWVLWVVEVWSAVLLPWMAWGMLMWMVRAAILLESVAVVVSCHVRCLLLVVVPL